MVAERTFTLPDIQVAPTYRDTVNASRARLSDLLTGGTIKQAIHRWSDSDTGGVCFLELAYINGKLN